MTDDEILVIRDEKGNRIGSVQQDSNSPAARAATRARIDAAVAAERQWSREKEAAYSAFLKEKYGQGFSDRELSQKNEYEESIDSLRVYYGDKNLSEEEAIVRLEKDEQERQKRKESGYPMAVVGFLLGLAVIISGFIFSHWFSGIITGIVSCLLFLSSGSIVPRKKSKRVLITGMYMAAVMVMIGGFVLGIYTGHTFKPGIIGVVISALLWLIVIPVSNAGNEVDNFPPKTRAFLSDIYIPIATASRMRELKAAVTQMASRQPLANVPRSVVIPAPVAGTVLRYVVDNGAEVKSGDTVLILESMRMELEIKALDNGKVHFLVAAGTQVAAQQPIAEIG
ncbi:biotin/lipoyl-containing protein [Treponema primitia]|uniref:biotin/lipoyl-containing protein n=1 Tax=Treponema primitia TaxID=88058 RepID=UPI003980773D